MKIERMNGWWRATWNVYGTIYRGWGTRPIYALRDCFRDYQERRALKKVHIAERARELLEENKAILPGTGELLD